MPAARHSHAGRPADDAAVAMIEPSPEMTRLSMSAIRPDATEGAMPRLKSRSSGIFLKLSGRGRLSLSGCSLTRISDLV